MVWGRVRRWSGSFSCQETESCRHQGEVYQNMITINDLLAMQWSSIQAPRWKHSSVKYNFVNMLLQGEWESNEASEDVFKDLLRVKKLSQRVSSVESETVSSFRLCWNFASSNLFSLVDLCWNFFSCERWRAPLYGLLDRRQRQCDVREQRPAGLYLHVFLFVFALHCICITPELQ